MMETSSSGDHLVDVVLWIWFTLTALGAQNAANSFGQASGALVGGALFVWQMNAPYVLSGGLLVAIALMIGWKALRGRGAATRAS